MARAPAPDRVPTERDVFCTVLGYLGNRPRKPCLDATAPQNLHLLGRETIETMFRTEYGGPQLAAAREWSQRIAEKFIELHPDALAPPPAPPAVDLTAVGGIAAALPGEYPFIDAEAEWDSLDRVGRDALLRGIGVAPEDIGDLPDRPYGVLPGDVQDVLDARAARAARG
ncbi:MAG: hypothetical protein IVW52_04855 [Acidimicrobiales bacterium]|nr:hypothetical protein [Acidimicrobiales bacterium]